MANADRERLIDLMIDAKRTEPETGSFTEYLADYLLEHGVTVTPCKVGDTVYIPWHWNNKNGIAFAEVEEIKIYDSNNHYMFLIDLQSDDEEFNQSFGGWKIGKSIGKTVFLTREEAERALKECKNNG